MACDYFGCSKGISISPKTEKDVGKWKRLLNRRNSKIFNKYLYYFVFEPF